MSDIVVLKRIFSNYDKLISYLHQCQDNNIGLEKSDLLECFGKDSVLICYSAKSKISPDAAQEAILTQAQYRLTGSKSVIIIYHVPEDYPLVNIAKLMWRIDEVINNNRCFMFSKSINETLFGVDLILNPLGKNSPTLWSKRFIEP